MADSESPASLFELLYCFFPRQQAIRIVYDNGCNFLQYALNRDPVWAGWVRVFVDELHSKGHVNCAASFDTGAHIHYVIPTGAPMFGIAVYVGIMSLAYHT